ncbi:uncharacterized protein LOC118798078 isoform X2 [Colossoma macropomum]|uniref:uncharacterized protein LOC118798078 isoform X2 n=1 Tax=Colossoma macropomum TaxID=42526 RepID=UPI001863AE4E|nr:uncharacterized protein LOC118798078 isoform X2 [Colossoma macropomum]
MGNASPSSGMLAVLMVAMLVSGWTEGSMLSKCEVKSQLEAAFEALQSVTADNNLAKWVCTVEATSRFNTSLVTIIDPSRPRRLIRRSFPIDNGPTQEVIADYFEDMFSKETLVTENPDGTSLIPEGMISTQVAEELSIPPEAVIEDFIPASSSRQPKERLAEASTQDNKPSERNPIHSVDRQGRDHRKEKVHEIKTREASGEIIDFSGDYSGQGSKEEASGEAPEGSGDLTEEPLEPPFSTPEYPIDDTVYPDSDLGHGSGDHTEQPVVPSTSSPEYPIDETFYPGYDSGEGSGEGSGIRPHFSYKQYWNLLFKRKIVSSFKLTKSPVDSRELLSEPPRTRS